MLSQLSGPISVYEVSPRDGLQNEAKIIGLADKRELVHSLDGCRAPARRGN